MGTSAERFRRAMARRVGGAQYLRDVARHGANQGHPGLTYHSDLARVYARWEAEIWEILRDYAEDIGDLGPLSVIAAKVDDPVSFRDYMVWAAVEIVAGDAD